MRARGAHDRGDRAVGSIGRPSRRPGDDAQLAGARERPAVWWCAGGVGRCERAE